MTPAVTCTLPKLCSWGNILNPPAPLPSMCTRRQQSSCTVGCPVYSGRQVQGCQAALSTVGDRVKAALSTVGGRLKAVRLPCLQWVRLKAVGLPCLQWVRLKAVRLLCLQWVRLKAVRLPCLQWVRLKAVRLPCLQWATGSRQSDCPVYIG